MRIKICLPHYSDTASDTARACASALQAAGVPCDMYGCRSTIISYARNKLLANGENPDGSIVALPDDRYTHFLCVDDDVIYRPGDIIALIDSGCPVIGAAYTQRGNPFYYAAGTKDGPCVFRPLQASPVGIQRVSYVGAGCMLIQSDALRRMSGTGNLPWFRFMDVSWSDDTGVPHTVSLGEDVGFGVNAESSGIPIHVHTGVRVKHTVNHEHMPYTITLEHVSLQGFGDAVHKLLGWMGHDADKEIIPCIKWIQETAKAHATRSYKGEALPLDIPLDIPFSLPLRQKVVIHSDNYFNPHSFTKEELTLLEPFVTVKG